MAKDEEPSMKAPRAFIFGDFGQLFTGGEKIAMFACEECGHVEFFIPPK
jgi:hypothetical protein